LMATTWEDEDKINYFETWLKSGSVAEQWFRSLEAAKKTTWKELCIAFKERWPERAVTQKTTAEKQAELEGEKITEAELGTKVRVNGTETYAHIAWANKVEKLARAVPDNNNLLVVGCRRQLPPTLKALVSSSHDMWTSFCTAVRAIRPLDIEEEKERQDKQTRIEGELQRPQRTDTEKLALIARIPPPQPNTPAGWAAYEADLAAWIRTSYGRPAHEGRPHPLTPGTSPVASGECFSCGHTGHPSAACTTNRKVPEGERAWRQKANSIRAGANAASRASNSSVNLVEEDNVFVSRDEYDAAVIARYLADQNQVKLHGLDHEAVQVWGLFDNGALVDAIPVGCWKGTIELGGATVTGSFKVFDSNGGWDFLFGKRLLMVFNAVHDYATDEVFLP
ncbi:hypothetical protein K443DRAFT_32029, partial [Laccaria amethystina LaAM-08-1]